MFNLAKITLNTFTESIREPVYFLMLFSGLVLIGHYPSAALFVFSEQLKLVVDSSMATGMLFGLIASILCSSYTVSREMRNGTVLLLLAKPVFRWSFVLGKIIGIALAATLFTVICNFATIISVYIACDQFRMDMNVYYLYMGALAVVCLLGMAANYLKGSSFSEICCYALVVIIPIFALLCLKFRPEPTLKLVDLAKALVLINFAVVMMSTLAVVFATRLDVVANLLVSALVFFLGLMSSYLFKTQSDFELINWIFAGFYAIVPNWQYFWLADAIAVNRPIPTGYLINAAVYMIVYVIIAAMWAVALFQNKEVAGDGRM